MKNKKGFTLIELLAVIVVLAIIALIATPIVMNVIKSVQEKSYKNSVDSLIREAEYYYTAGQEKIDRVYYVKNGKLESSDITVKGKLPGDGILSIKSDGRMAVSLIENKNCYKKGYDEPSVTITKDISNCNLINDSDFKQESIYKKLSAKSVTDYQDGMDIVNGLVRYQDNTVYNVGNVENNYIWFGGFLWRIVGYDQMANIKLVSANPLTTISLGEENNTNQASLKNSYVGHWLTNQFLNNFARKDDLLTVSYQTPDIESKYSTWSSKISLLTVDDFTKMGGFDNYQSTYKTTNYYTKNNNTFIPASVHYLADIAYKSETDKSSIRVRYVDNGNYGIYRVGMGPVKSIHPEVTISGNKIVSKGLGTYDNPYILEGEKEATVLSEVNIGEYISLPNGETARLMSSDTTGMKFKNVRRMATGINNDDIMGSLNEIRQSVENYITGAKKYRYYEKGHALIEETTSGISIEYLIDKSEHIWYDNWFGSGKNYLSDTQSEYKGSYGIPLYGELFSLNDHGYGSREMTPAYYLKKNIKIESGSGTYLDPYVIK